jgi:hypothetical protein
MPNGATAARTRLDPHLLSTVCAPLPTSQRCLYWRQGQRIAPSLPSRMTTCGVPIPQTGYHTRSTSWSLSTGISHNNRFARMPQSKYSCLRVTRQCLAFYNEFRYVGIRRFLYHTDRDMTLEVIAAQWMSKVSSCTCATVAREPSRLTTDSNSRQFHQSNRARSPSNVFIVPSSAYRRMFHSVKGRLPQ